MPNRLAEKLNLLESCRGRQLTQSSRIATNTLLQIVEGYYIYILEVFIFKC